MCFNRKMIVGLCVAAVALLVVRGRSGVGFLPVLIALACPLSMLAMFGGMAAKHGTGAHGADTAAKITDPNEVAQLRAEVAELRAGQADRVPAEIAHRPEP